MLPCRLAALREAGGRVRLLDMAAMTQRVSTLAVTILLALSACKKQPGAARALALDPDDPEVLRSVADLHVRRVGARDDLELALQYVHRALAGALRGKDKPLLKELYLLQAMALDDLGRPGEALGAASK